MHHGQLFVKTVCTDYVGLNLVRHDLLEVDESTGLLPLHLVVFFIAFLEQVEVLVRVSDNDEVSIGRNGRGQVLNTVWNRLWMLQFRCLLIELVHDKDQVLQLTVFKSGDQVAQVRRDARNRPLIILEEAELQLVLISLDLEDVESRGVEPFVVCSLGMGTTPLETRIDANTGDSEIVPVIVLRAFQRDLLKLINDLVLLEGLLDGAVE